MRGVREVAPYGRCLKYCDNIAINTDENGICNALLTKIYRGNVGGGEQNCDALQGMSSTPRFYT